MSDVQPEPAETSSPKQFGLRTWWTVLTRVWVESDAKNIGLISAGVAFYAMLSLFPGIAALIAIWGFVADPATIAEQLDMAEQLVPEAAFLIVEDQIAALIASNESTLQLTSLVSILAALWTSRQAVAALIRGLNAVYRETHRTNPFVRYAMAVGLTALLVGVALFAFAAVVMVPVILAVVTVPVGIELLISLFKWAILLGVFLFCVGLLYRYGPNRRGARLSWVSPGALFALLTWTAGSAAFSIYLRNFGSLNEVYGSIGAVIALLLWFYISAYVVLLGALLNAELELQTAEDTTAGTSRPAGQRRAFVADHVKTQDGGVRLARASREAGETAENTGQTETEENI